MAPLIHSKDSPMFTKKAFSLLLAGLTTLFFAGQSLALDPQPEPPKEKPKLGSASKAKVSPKAKGKAVKPSKPPVAQKAVKPTQSKVSP